MQTFLPFADFEETAACLDYKRLGKQRVEAWQILECLIGAGSLRWAHHPAVKMWKGYTHTLAEYGRVMCKEWVSRGYKDTMTERFLNILPYLADLDTAGVKPPWFGDEAFHYAHRANLVRKAPQVYLFFWPDIPRDNEVPYVWPA
jgi:hypothetical protein